MTPMHFQYLCGLCCLRTQPSAIDLTLGDRVYDIGSDSGRDVDVTIVLAEGDSVTGIIGCEAKLEAKPLDQSKVEQLCIKLNDMPSLTKRMIVSANGYSETAKRKAKHHGVELWEFRDWTNPVQNSFPSLSLKGPPSEALRYGCAQLMWQEQVEVRVNPEDMNRSRYSRADWRATPVVGHPSFNSIGSLVDYVGSVVLDSIRKTKEVDDSHFTASDVPPPLRQDGPMGPEFVVDNYKVSLENAINMVIDGDNVPLSAISFSGVARWNHSSLSAEYRVLTHTESGEAFAGASIASVPGMSNTMLAAMIGNDSIAQFRIIRLTDKQVNFLHKLKIRS